MTRLSTVSASEAQDVVKQIAEENGFMPESILEKLTQKDRETAEKVLKKKDEMIGASVLTYAYPQICRR